MGSNKKLCGGEMVCKIPLTRGHITVVDDCDSDLLDSRWYASTKQKHTYAYKSIDRKCIAMHRIILERKINRPLLKSEMVDHINGDTLNNCRDNLRPVTPSQNAINSKTRCNNTSGYKGVYFSKHHGKWSSKIRFDGKRKYLGLFDTPQAAYQAYCNAARELQGEFFRK